MAYMNKERKAARMPAIKAVLKKYNQKGSVSVRNYSTLVVKVKDTANMFADEFKTDYDKRWGLSVNPYHFQSHYADKPKAVKFLKELTDAMYGTDYYDNTDAMIDYFDTSHYIDVDIFQAA